MQCLMSWNETEYFVVCYLLLFLLLFQCHSARYASAANAVCKSIDVLETYV
jgi:hypothetical protein